MPAARTHTVILDWIEDQLRTGALGVGDKLPGERALAERFGMSRASVREAIRVLDAMGLVRTSSGSGPRSGAVVVSEPSAALSWALRMHVATHALPVADIVAARVLLESDAARHGAQTAQAVPTVPESVPELGVRGTGPTATVVDRERVLAEAAATLDRMDDPELASDEFHRLDAAFHLLLATLGGNIVVQTVMASLREATVGYVREAVSRLDDWEPVRARLQQQHREILAAVSARDGQVAARRLTEHIEWFHGLQDRL